MCVTDLEKGLRKENHIDEYLVNSNFKRTVRNWLMRIKFSLNSLAEWSGLFQSKATLLPGQYMFYFVNSIPSKTSGWSISHLLVVQR